MSFLKVSITFLACVIAAACATPYQSDGLTGGFTESPLGENIWRVTFQGNGFTTSQNSADMALLRSADLTLKQGFTHFALADSQAGAISISVATPAYSTTTGTLNMYGNTGTLNANTVRTGGQNYNIVAPSATNVVVMFNGKPEVRGMVYDAEFLCRELAKKYKSVCDVKKN